MELKFKFNKSTGFYLLKEKDSRITINEVIFIFKYFLLQLPPSFFYSIIRGMNKVMRYVFKTDRCKWI